MLDDIEIGEEYVCRDKTAKSLSNWKMNVIRFLCLLVFLQGLAVKAEEVERTSLTERAGYNFGGFFFTLFPMIVHPNINARSNAEKGIVKFHLYNRGPMTSRGRSSTRNKEKNFKLLDPTKMTETLSNFNTSLPTMILVHGFQETDSAIAVRGLLSAISRSGGWNVVFVDWHQLSAGPWYPWAIYNIRAAGRLVANFIDSLALAVEKNSNQTSNDIPRNRRSPVSTFLENLHIVGFSLGAHVAGIAGHHVSVGKVGRVTGLDPAYPLIELLSSKESRLDESDAEFVDIIHTSSGVYGTPYTSGHADFFPNGGKSIQPGCNSVAFPYVCSHWRSWRFFAESLLNPNSFESLPCESWEKFTDGECDHYLNDANNGPVNMGVGSRKTARGKYFLRTYPDPPFSMAL